ncbi:MAG TPA: hypothetical protein DCQ92_08280 [Verrucomicrobia subdivision 3 bacterium]|nr:hypothetical protein [Limisphaerales bacterium]
MKMIKTLLMAVILSAPLVAPWARGDVIFKTLVSFTFTNAPNYGATGSGAQRTGSMVQGDDGSFYGTTQLGGPVDKYRDTWGTIFKMTPDGTFTNIYLFGTLTNGGVTPLDGAAPVGNLIKGADGNLYGTASAGGANNGGTVFQITTNGALAVIHSFGGNSLFDNDPNVYAWTNADGSNPLAGVVQGRDGNYYGTTSLYGANGQGTVFQLTPGGILTTLHAFSAALTSHSETNGDGAMPMGELVEGDDGNFYGTTELGGVYGLGTIFRIAPDGTFTNLVMFDGTNNGAHPFAGLCKGKDGNFYGTTLGVSGSYNTVFQIITNGVLTKLHDFSGGPNDGEPLAKLIQGSDGNFYGTTYANTVFQITANGRFTVLHLFSHLDGWEPEASLVQGTDGSFYGTTSAGGASYDPSSGSQGYGTIFRITIPPAFQTITQTNGVVALTWSIMPGQKYQLQSNTDLSSTNWLNLGSSVTASNTIVSASDSMTNSRRFYRIMLTQ